MFLKPQDVMVVLKLVSLGPVEWSYNELAVQLGMSPSEVHAAVKRLLQAHLAAETESNILANVGNLEEFLSHGLKYAFVPELGQLTRGLPTRYAAPPLQNTVVSSNEPPPVWPDPEGTVRGVAFSPIYPSAPGAARRDKKLYEMLTLVDALRGGSARERNLAVVELKKRLHQYGKTAKSKS